MNTAAKSSWLTVLGQPRVDIETTLSNEVSKKVASGEFSRKDIAYIATLSRSIVPDSLNVDDEALEKLRYLCRSWEVDLNPAMVTSHRKLIGPFIVLAKRITYRVLRVLLKDFILRQREFNAATILIIAELANNHSKTS